MMRTFKTGNWSDDDVCPLCNTQEEGEVILVPIVGTQEGNLVQATQVHTVCLQKNIMFDPSTGLVYAANWKENGQQVDSE